VPPAGLPPVFESSFVGVSLPQPHKNKAKPRPIGALFTTTSLPRIDASGTRRRIGERPLRAFVKLGGVERFAEGFVSELSEVQSIALCHGKAGAQALGIAA
jgi:hypothetical protein